MPPLAGPLSYVHYTVPLSKSKGGAKGGLSRERRAHGEHPHERACMMWSAMTRGRPLPDARQAFSAAPRRSFPTAEPSRGRDHHGTRAVSPCGGRVVRRQAPAGRGPIAGFV